MHLQVPIIVRTIDWIAGTPAAVVPKSELIAYYRVWGVELSFAEGPNFDFDPTDSIGEIDTLRNSYQPTGGAPTPALLIVAKRHIEGAHINGVLLDTKKRGISAVFTGAIKFSEGDAETRFEIFAHEIGHLLNMVHGHADTDYATIIDPYDRRRTANRDKVWERCISASTGASRTAMENFYDTGARRPKGLPLSVKCRQHLATPPTSHILPWGGKFDDEVSEGTDADSHIVCGLSVYRDQIEMGEPIDLAITVDLDQDTAAAFVPRGLGLSERTMELWIHGPDGVRRYTPRNLVCADGKRLLTPRSLVRRSYSLLTDENGLLFPSQGEYALQARLPAYGARSDFVKVHIASASQQLSIPALHGFLRAGMPAADDTGWTLLAEAARNPGLNRATRAHFANEISARRPGIAEPSRINASVAAARFESPRTYQRHLLLTASRMARSGAATQKAFAELLNQTELALTSDDQNHPTLEYIRELRRSSQKRSVK